MSFGLRALAGLPEREEHFLAHFAPDADQDFFGSGEADLKRDGGFRRGMAGNSLTFAGATSDQPMLGLVNRFGGCLGALRVPGPTVLELGEVFLR